MHAATMDDDHFGSAPLARGARIETSFFRFAAAITAVAPLLREGRGLKQGYNVHVVGTVSVAPLLREGRGLKQRIRQAC